MRFTIIPADKTVLVDGDPRVLDQPIIDLPGVHAVQWYDDHGEVEYLDAKKPSRRIFDLTPFQKFVDAHAAAKVRDELEAEEHRKQLEEAIAAEQAQSGQTA